MTPHTCPFFSFPPSHSLNPIYSSQTSIFIECSPRPTTLNAYPVLPTPLLLVRGFLPRSQKLNGIYMEVNWFFKKIIVFLTHHHILKQGFKTRRGTAWSPHAWPSDADSAQVQLSRKRCSLIKEPFASDKCCSSQFFK